MFGTNGKADRQIADALEQVDKLLRSISVVDDSEGGRPTTVLSYVKDEILSRSLRLEVLPPEIFGEPAWDMLLDLYVAHETQLDISVTSVCIASNAPSTTALRWLKYLENQNFVHRRPDRSDGRREFVSLTAMGRNKIDEYFTR